MSRLTLIASLLLLSIATQAQLNMRLLSQIRYNEDASSLWGWTHPTTGTEYALVGLYHGVSIVSLADPENAAEVAYVPGANGIWRELKTWGNFAYVTNEIDGGLQVIDLTHLPDSVSYYNWQPFELAFGTPLTTCHTIFIDQNGIAFLNGCNWNNGGILYVDVATTPGVPKLLGWGPPVYAHDSYARDNKLYSAELYLGQFAVYDVSDKTQTAQLGIQPTPYRFTHNVWLSDDSKVIYTTDEKANASVAAYDISDLSDIKLLDEFRPVKTLNKGVIPHNVHVWNDYLIVSYYTDGCILVDASRPGNLVEVGNFDSFFGSDGGFDGVWGVYPYFASGTIIASDISNGLVVLGPNYQRACWLEGKVRDAVTDQPVGSVSIQILSPQPNAATTDFTGKYSTGQVYPGTFNVEFRKAGYESKVVPVTLSNGQLTLLDVVLKPTSVTSLSGKISSEQDGRGIFGAKLKLLAVDTTYDFQAAFDGSFSIQNIPSGAYKVIAGAWGYQYFEDELTLSGNAVINIFLKNGYRDDFLFNYDWTTATDGLAATGFWVRGKPIGTVFNGTLVNPGIDLPNDLGDACYMTGNRSGSASTDDVDGGKVFLTSPRMDLTSYQNPILNYSLWFFNAGGQGTPPDDQLIVKVANGRDTVTIETQNESLSEWRPASSIRLVDKISITHNMRVIFETGDSDASPHLVEAALDGFSVIDSDVSDIEYPDSGVPEVFIFPNPFTDWFTLILDPTPAEVQLFDISGRPVFSTFVNGQSSRLEVGSQLEPGVYFLTVMKDGRRLPTQKIVKI